jgi:hypothetical protein
MVGCGFFYGSPSGKNIVALGEVFSLGRRQAEMTNNKREVSTQSNK